MCLYVKPAGAFDPRDLQTASRLISQWILRFGFRIVSPPFTACLSITVADRNALGVRDLCTTRRDGAFLDFLSRFKTMGIVHFWLQANRLSNTTILEEDLPPGSLLNLPLGCDIANVENFEAFQVFEGSKIS